MRPFKEEEYVQLIRRAGAREGATDEQLHWFIKQCERMKFQALLLDAIQAGQLVVSNITEKNFDVSLARPTGPASREEIPGQNV